MYPKTAAATYRDGERADHRLSTLGFRIVRLPGKLSPVTIVPPATSANSAVPLPAPVSDFVTIGAPGNEDDPLYGLGGVADVFEIQRFEISNADYSTFLNAVARHGDSFSLFRADMMTGVAGGIVRERDGKSFRYASKPGWARRPVTYLTWFSLARYANWHHYGRPDTGIQSLGSTEGNDREGAYDTRSFPATSRGRVRPKDIAE